MPRPTPAQVSKMRSLYGEDNGITRQELSAATGVGQYQCRKWLKAVRADDEVSATERFVEAERGKAARKADKTVMLELAETKAALDAMTSLKGTVPKVSEIRHVPHSGREATAVMVVSDLHIDETVRKEEVNGLNFYDHEVAVDAVRQIFHNGMTLVAKERHAVDINHLYIGLLGDMLSGTIHNELLERNSCSPVQAVLWLQDMLASGLHHVMDNFDGIVTVVCCVGNHGRTTDKIRCASQVDNSYEYLLYCSLRNHFAANPRINFVIEKGYMTYTTIYGKVVRWHHGHSIKYQGGIGGITIPLNRKIERWNRGKRADLDVLGHFHSFQDGGNYIINGSAMGYNAYAVKIGAAFEPPKQTFFLLDSKHWKTVVAPILIDRDV